MFISLGHMSMTHFNFRINSKNVQNCLTFLYNVIFIKDLSPLKNKKTNSDYVPARELSWQTRLVASTLRRNTTVVAATRHKRDPRYQLRAQYESIHP